MTKGLLYLFAGFVVLGVLGLFVFHVLFSVLFSGHLWYFYMLSASWRCCISFLGSSDVKQIALALCASVLMTLYFAVMWWWLTHCRYLSVCSSFLYTPVVGVPSDVGVVGISKKGIAPSGLVFPTVNGIALPVELMCCRNLSLCVLYDKSVIYISFPSRGWCSAFLMAVFSYSSIYMLATMGLIDEPVATPSLCW